MLHPRELVDEGLKRFSKLNSSANVETQISTELPNVAADFTKLAQVIVNLSLNAFESGDEEPKVSISVGVENLSEADLENMNLRHKATTGKLVSVNVDDDGGGMDDTTIRRVFDTFFTTKAKGTGMGLSFVAGLLSSHNAPILLTSDPELGSSFRFWLRASDELPNQAAESSASDKVRNPVGRLLLVDDDDSVRRSTSRILKLWGYEVVAAASGDQAIELFQESGESFDLAIVDLYMPVVDGLAVAKYMKLMWILRTILWVTSRINSKVHRQM